VSKPFDATPKALLELRPPDWPAFLGVPARSVEVVDADVSTVTAATDKVLLVRSDDGDRIQHFDFQSGPDASVPRRSHGYSALLEERHELPVDSVVVLLHPKANLRTISGVYERRLPGEAEPYLRFRYRVIRVWELPVETVLRAGIAVLPLAPISNVTREQLPAVIAAMEQRLESEPNQDTVGKVWTAAGVLLGMEYDKGFVQQLFSRVRAMKDSTFYQGIVEEGQVKEARRILLRLGLKNFGGPPTPEQQTALDAITELTRLEDLVERVGQVGNWADLLETPPTPPAPRRRKKS
jgi:predicted transposase YdaD